MKHVLLTGLATFALLSGFAIAQQQDDEPVAPQKEPAKASNLGSSVDDLLENQLSRPEIPAADPVQEAIQQVTQPTSVQPTGPVGLSSQDEPQADEPAGPEDVSTLLTENAPEFDEFGNLIEDEVEEIEYSYDQYQLATLRALDKITGRSVDIRVKADEPIVFGSLNIEMKTCYQTPPELPPESAAFLSIKSTQAVRVETMKEGVDASTVSTVSEDNPRLFSGWMFASSPGLSALEHPVYDVWVIRCNAS